MKNRVKKIVDELQGKGLRRSLSRESIILAIISRSKPVSVCEIIKIMESKKKRFNKTTIYREIEVLKKYSVIREVYFRNDTALYEIAEDHHHHLVCVSCGTVRDVRLTEPFQKEEDRLARLEKFTILEHSLEFFGLCEKCQGEKVSYPKNR